MSEIKDIGMLAEQYCDVYRQRYAKPSAKIPLDLPGEENVLARLAAIYQVIVEERGHSVIWDKSTTENIISVTKWLVHSPQRGLLLNGSLGNGKSTMLKSVFRLFESRSVLVEAKSIYDEFKKTETLSFPPGKILLIDDLGAEPERCLIFGEEHHPLTDLLLSRYARNATTIIATNLTVDDIHRRYGDRVYDRMLEMFTAILYVSPSYRSHDATEERV